MPPSKFFKLHSKSEFTMRDLVLSCKSFRQRTVFVLTPTQMERMVMISREKQAIQRSCIRSARVMLVHLTHEMTVATCHISTVLPLV